MRAPRWAIALVGAAVVVAVAGMVAPPPGSAGFGPGCSADFPRQLPRASPGDTAAQGLLVCTNQAGTATLIRNSSRVVWTVAGPEPLAFFRLPAPDLVRSFEALLEGRPLSVPSGASLVVPRPAGSLLLRRDAPLTVAQLVHDRLVTGLSRQRSALMPAATDPAPTLARDVLTICLVGVLELAGEPGALLRSAAAAGRLDNAAAEVATDPTTPCGLIWIRANYDAGLPFVDVTPFSSDVYGARENRDFAARVRAATDAFAGIATAAGSDSS